MDENVEPAEASRRALGEAGGLCRQRHVAEIDRHLVRTEFCKQRGRFLGLRAAVDHDLAACFQQMLCYAEADSPRASGDDGELAGDFVHALFPEMRHASAGD
jgi:hypothetical protein